MKKYMELYREMRQDIVEGRYGFSERLPSKRYLSEERGISLITVEHALALLEEEGYIEGKERSGYFVSYQEGDVFPVTDKEEKSIFSRGKLLFPGSKCPIPPLPKRCGEP